MTKINIKKLFFALGLALVLFSFSINYIFAADLELDYPQVQGAETPNSTKTLLPEYIQYLFSLSVIIAGLIAFVSFVFGGFRYLSSAGSPNAIRDAKEQITGGILGLILILGSYLLLTTINPQLVALSVLPKQFQQGVILYAGGCEGASPSGEDGVDFLRVRRSMSDLEGFNDKTKSIYIYNPGTEMEVFMYSGTGWQSKLWEKRDQTPNCYDVEDGGKSIRLFWKMAGVYLFEQTDYKVDTAEARLFVYDIAEFVDWHDKARSIKIMPSRKQYCDAGPGAPGGCDSCPDCTTILPGGSDCSFCMKYDDALRYGAILHENTNFEGDCEVFFVDNPDFGDAGKYGVCPNTGTGPYCVQTVGPLASAIHVFKQQLGVSSGEGVTIYENYDFNQEPGKEGEGHKCGPYTGLDDDGHTPQFINLIDDPSGSGGCDGGANLAGKISSIRVEGEYVALLFNLDGRCQVFKEPGDLRLKGEPIGNDKPVVLMVIPVSKED